MLKMIKTHKNKMIALAAMSITLVLAPEFANAAVGGAAVGGTAEFGSIWTTLMAWTQGTLGRIITLLIIVAGIGAGIMQQSLWSFVIGIAAGLGLYNAPTIITALMPAVL